MADPYTDLATAKEDLIRLTDSHPHLIHVLHVPIVAASTILTLLHTLTRPLPTERDTTLVARSAALMGLSSIRQLLKQPPSPGLTPSAAQTLRTILPLFECYQALGLHTPLRAVN